jgi:hypothetical protein
VTTIVLLVLIGLCILGIAATVVTTPQVGGARPEIERFLGLVLGFGILDLLVIGLALYLLWRWGLRGAAHVSVLRVLGLVALSLVTIAAVVIVSIATGFGLMNLR